MTSVKINPQAAEHASRVRWVRIGGVCGFISALVLIGAAILNLNLRTIDILEPSPTVLSFFESFLYGTADAYLALAGTVLFIVAAAGLYAMLADAHDLSWTAPAAVAIGAILLMLTLSATWILGRQFGTQLFETTAVPPSTSPLMATALTATGLLLVAGCALVYGVGVSLYGYFLYAWPILPNWIGRLGILAGILQVGWLDVLAPAPLSSWLLLIKTLNIFLFLSWLAISAAAMVRVSDIAVSP